MSRSALEGSAAYHQVCQQSNPLLCLRDPSDGGAGTPIKMSAYGGDQAENWSFFISSSACNNTGKVESGCGLPDFLVDRYGGDDIVVFKQEVSNDCVKFSADTHWLGTMGTCDDNTTLLIYASCNSSGYCYFPSIAASEASGMTQWMCGNADGGQPFTGSGCADITWGLFQRTNICAPRPGFRNPAGVPSLGFAGPGRTPAMGQRWGWDTPGVP